MPTKQLLLYILIGFGVEHIILGYFVLKTRRAHTATILYALGLSAMVSGGVAHMIATERTCFTSVTEKVDATRSTASAWWKKSTDWVGWK